MENILIDTDIVIDYLRSKKKDSTELEKIMNTYTAIIHKEDNLYVAECPEIGTASQGETIEEAVKNLQEATELYLEEFPINQISRSILTTFEVSTNA